MKKLSAGCFENYGTWEVLSDKVTKALYEAADIEFSTIIGASEVNGTEVHDIREQAEVIKAFACAYIDGLAELHCNFACRFSGDQSAEKELCAKFRRQGNQFGKRGLKHIAKTLSQLIPKRVIPDRY